MTVGELKKLLEKYSDLRVVVLSRDAEGNGYSPLAGVATGAYREESAAFGEIGLEALTPEDEERGYTKEDVFDDGLAALVLTPLG